MDLNMETFGNQLAIELIKNSDAGLGNTKAKPRIVPGKKWVFTFNNYTLETMETLETNFKKDVFLKYFFSEEVGEQGTKHLQGFIMHQTKIRPIERYHTKDVHWEKMKGTQEQNMYYCSKSGNPVHTNMDWIREDLFCKNFPMDELYPWQKKIVEISRTEPDRRKIYWIWEEQGCKGKSFLCKWMAMHERACKLITCTKSADILTCADVFTKTYLFDIPRSNELMRPWNSYEQLKNGYVCDSKLKKTTEVYSFAPPHIICFANFEPEYAQMSSDRWIVFKVNQLM